MGTSQIKHFKSSIAFRVEDKLISKEGNLRNKGGVMCRCSAKNFI